MALPTASDNPFSSLLVTEGSAPSSPAAGKQRLFVDSSDHLFKLKNSSGTVTAVGGGGSGSITASGYTQATAKMLGRSTASTGAIEEIGVGTGLSLSGGTLSSTAGTDDPVAAIFGTPDTAFEFDTSSLSGLTGFGSPATEDANTTVPSCLFYKATDTSTAWHGRYIASPSTPFTAMVKVASNNIFHDYSCGSVFVGVANPGTGALVSCSITHNTNYIVLQEKFTNRTTYSSTAGSWVRDMTRGGYVAVVVNSTTSIDYYASPDGRVWAKFLSANNPSLTVGSVGVGMKSEYSGGASVAFDFFRVWNSAKTFPGA